MPRLRDLRNQAQKKTVDETRVRHILIQANTLRTEDQARLRAVAADTVAAWMVDDYFDLQGPQEDDFRARFERFHAWHRKAQLPEYARFMRAARTRMQGELSRDEDLSRYIL